MGPHPAVAEVRSAVRRAIGAQPPGTGLLVACSGGPDSVALAAAVAFESAASGRSAGLVTVDHGLQPGSASRARQVAALGWELGLHPVTVLPVRVGSAGGPEAAARAARYAALDAVRGPAAVLLGHTCDDQAETVLLGLGRGAGPGSIAGMPAAAGGYLRPLLGVRRSVTEAACAALGLPVWHDPHNADPRFRRVRVRREVLPLLEDVLAGGVTQALARTALRLQEDEATLDELADRLIDRAGPPAQRLIDRAADPAGLAVAALADEPPGLVGRALKRWAERSGAGPLTAVHVAALLGLVRRWHGQGAVDVPGGLRVRRISGRLVLDADADADADAAQTASPASAECQE